MKTLSIVALTAVLALFGGEKTVMAQSPKDSEIIVFAAASLTEAFQSIAQDFKAAHPKANIQFNFGGSQQLVQQIAHGANVDVFASANAKQMDAAVTSGGIDSASVRQFARNHLVVIVPAENAAQISSLADLANGLAKIVLADKSVPVGQYALEVLDRCEKSGKFPSGYKENVLQSVVSYEENVKAVLGKVVLGEADAGIVYTSDISRDSTHKIRQIPIPDSLNVVAEYPIGISRKASRFSKEFVEYVCSSKGQATLKQFGFSTVGK